jgi:chromosomal replication initiation ATPase DnaA
MTTPANARALAAIDGWRDWPGGKLALVGPSGSGKTHLAHVWAAESGATILPARGIAGADARALAARGAVVVEDMGTLPAEAADERALLHLHNHLLAEGGRLLMTARAAPARWPIALPDLASRMQATGVATLDPPDDALLSAVLVKLFADRQVTVPPSVIDYLLTRMERSLAAARDLVARLDAHALAEGHAITRPFTAGFFRDILREDSEAGARPAPEPGDEG